MNVASLRFLAPGMAMVATAALALALTPVPVPPERRPDLDRIISTHFGSWRIDPSIVPIPPTPDVRASLENIYDATISRAYISESGQSVMLTIAYSSQQIHSSEKVHRQEVCYESQGFAINGFTEDSLRVIGERQLPLLRFVATRSQRVEPVTYWFRTGRLVAHSHFGRLIGFLQGILGEVPEGMLVRVSNLSNDSGRSYILHDEFIRALLESMAPQDRVHFVGKS